MRPIACIARPATSKTRRRTSYGYLQKGEMVRPTGPCDDGGNSGYDSESREERKIVKLRKTLALASSFAALSLGACSTTMMTRAERARPAAPQASASIAGTYLAANFAAAQGDVKAATGFYANSLKDDPANADLLERTFLFAAEAGEIDQAIGLTDRVLIQDASNRPAHLVLEVGALAKKDYAAVLKDVGTPSPGLFAALTNRVIEAWALAGLHDFDGAVNALDSLTTQRGVDGLRLMHRAL